MGRIIAYHSRAVIMATTQSRETYHDWHTCHSVCVIRQYMAREIPVGKCPFCGIIGWHLLRECNRLARKMAKQHNELLEVKV